MDFDKWLQRFVTKVEKIIFALPLDCCSAFSNSNFAHGR